MIPIFARKDFPGYLSNLVTGDLMVDNPDGVVTPDGLGCYAAKPHGSPLHQGAMHDNEGRERGNRAGKAKTLTVK